MSHKFQRGNAFPVTAAVVRDKLPLVQLYGFSAVRLATGKLHRRGATFMFPFCRMIDLNKPAGRCSIEFGVVGITLFDFWRNIWPDFPTEAYSQLIPRTTKRPVDATLSNLRT